jgi:PAS domain S-box-containing protein
MAKKSTDEPSGQPDLSATVPIVAIGASAGGIDAMRDLLTKLPSVTGMAYVYIQHLDSQNPVNTTELLASSTQMPVRDAHHLTVVQPDHLYVVPPDENLEVIDGVFTQVDEKSRPVIHMPIDHFFLSLTNRQKKSAIAVLLSGTASDGTLGLRAIKAAGGITFAQDDTAQYQSMPRSAILEGVVDKILSPIKIAAELERLSHQTDIFRATLVREEQEVEPTDQLVNTQLAGTEEDLRNIIQLLRRSAGVDFSHYKTTTIRRRIIRRTLLFKLDSLHDYVVYLRQHPEELAQLYDDLLINVTSFFRDTDTMDYVQKVLLPQILREKPGHDPIRIWVPACSTGQEAYSLAILLLEVMGDHATNHPIQLFATDLSESAVAKARLGSYTRGEVMNVSTRRLQRFFTKVDDHYRINKTVRDLCVFAPHNLLKDPPFSRLDLISCRNLLIYLDNTLQRKAIVTFHYALNPIGYLMMGKSETVGTSAPLFSQLEKNYKIFARKNDVDSRATFTMSPPRPVDSDHTMVRLSSVPRRTTKMGDYSSERHTTSSNSSELDQIVDGILLSQFVPASVVVNQDLEILQFRGSTGLFLEPAPGKASLNLIKMARPSLVFELRNIVNKAQKSGERVRKGGLEVKLRNKVYYVDIEAVPLDTATEERLFLVIFEEVDPPVVASTRNADARNRRIQELEAELTALREDMRSIIEEQEASNEELQSANEEIISSNEELQSINEELETSKEEIESTNEELLTINQELQVRNDQLSEAYQFAEDIFGTIREATLVLDTDLRVKSANPAFYRLFNLTEELTERRLIYELDSRQWDIPQLRLMLTDIVTSDTQFQGFELTYNTIEMGEKRLSLNARRVVRQQDSILLAIDDITQQQRVQRLLAEREAWSRQIADNAPTLIWVTDAQGNYTFLNKVWSRFTGRSLQDVTMSSWETGLFIEDQSIYQTTYQSSVALQQPFQIEYRLRRHDGQYRWMVENAQPMYATDGQFNGYIGSLADIHVQKEANQELDRRVRERTVELNTLNINLERINQHLKQIQDIAQISTYEYDIITGQLYLSDEMLKFFGYSRSGFQPTLAFLESITHPDDVESIRATIRQAMVDAMPYSYVRRIIWPDGQIRYLLSRAERLPDTKSRVLVSVLDITNTKQVEEQLRERTNQLVETNKLMQLTLKASKAGLGYWDWRNDSTVWDERGKQIVGFISDEEMLSVDGWMNRIHPDDRLLVKSNSQASMQSGEPFLLEYRVIHEDGSIHYLLGTGQMQKGPDGKPLSSVGLVIDVSELKQTEQMLKQTALNLQAVLNSSNMAIAFVKPVRDSEQVVVNFQVATANREFARLVDKPIDRLIGQHITDLDTMLWQEQTVETLRQVLAGKSFHEERQHPETKQWILLTLKRYDDGIMLTGQDITALKEAERQQHDLIHQLEDSNENLQILGQLRQQLRERGELLRSTSHDLRGNFGIIQGAASLLTIADTDEERSQMLVMLQRNIQQATRMLTELLDVARLEAGQEERHITAFDVAELLGALIDSVRPMATGKGLLLKQIGPSSLPVSGDGTKINRIVQNLLLNAIKYTQQGQITVEWQAGPDDQWQLIVTDTGPGLSTTSWNSGGEGIGLTITRQLCQLLDGRMDIDSRPEVGTRFTLTFPRTYPSSSKRSDQ